MTPPLGARPVPVMDRALGGLADAMRLRQFLIDSYALAGREFNWEPRRWEGMFWTDGSVVAFAGFTVDSANGVATLEPVGTRDGHRRLGLAQAAICEGLQRVARRAVDVVHVANWGPPRPVICTAPWASSTMRPRMRGERSFHHDEHRRSRRDTHDRLRFEPRPPRSGGSDPVADA